MTDKHLIDLCQRLQLSTVAKRIEQVCQQAARQQPSHADFLLDLLTEEEEARLQRRCCRRVKEAKFPRVKTLEGFDFSRAPQLPERLIRSLAEGSYLEEARAIIFMGEPGTGKTHLASALGYGAAQQGKRVRFTTVSQLVNLLIEARDSHSLSSIIQRYAGYKLLILDELGYVPLSKTDAELLFQVMSQRQESFATIVTTNLPFSEWTSIFPDQRLCKALVDRITHKAHIIETGEHSIRLQQTQKPGGGSSM